MTTARCQRCGAALFPEARFCPQCGLPGGSQLATRGAGRLPLAVATVALVAIIAALSWNFRGSAGAGEPAAGATGVVAAPPDISGMSPRERFDRLYNRSMQAAESGDAATLGTFGPMALLAYSQLDSVDADARYHAAMLRLHSGDVPGAAALADSILAADPGHLLGYVIEATIARWNRDSAGLAAARAAFLQHYDAEMARGRAEYADHRSILDDTRREALAGREGSLKS
ncbi:MAG TPA: zinc ribbon domain-containing protein [Gemmatimonadales bacterium]